jgi:sulfate adenylyltransferase subunit 1 (EFTu-like GTPase family)
MVDDPLTAGCEYILRLSTTTANARVTKLHNVVDVESYHTGPADALAMNQIGLVSLSMDKAVVIANYRDDRELGAFILVDRITNMTVALGTVELTTSPDGSALQAATCQPRDLSSYIGTLGSPQRIEFLHNMQAAIASALLIALVAGGASGSWLIGLIVMVMDLVTRPLIREALARLRERGAPGDDGGNDWGAGI